jgi:1-acyl-sn-glycerol-3-phosphate acyltransferase
MNILFAFLFSILSWSFFLANTIFWGTISVTSILYSPDGRVAHFCMRAWSKSNLWFCGVKLHVDGIENIDPEKVVIFASNHSSHFDIFILSAVIPVKFGWVAKEILFKIPFLGWHMMLNGYISVDRGNREKAINSMNEAAEKVKGGKRITIFPEGTRSRTGELLPFKKGLFHLCVQTGVPIVPIYINGAYHILKPDSMLLNPCDVFIKIGREMPTVGYSVEKLETIMGDLRERIVSLGVEADEMKKRFEEKK